MTETEKELIQILAKEKVSVAMQEFYVACIKSGKNPAYEILNVILTVTDGAVNLVMGKE